jgi:hypothetical protein
MEETGETWTGWGYDKPKKTNDPLTVTPENKATAALYTYTPWVLEGQGGNWLFWNVYRKYTHHILKTRPNHRWIGGPCNSDEHCAFENGYCNKAFGIGALIHPENYTGFCSQACDQFCPDSYSVFNADTFCIELAPGHDADADADAVVMGNCVSKCDDTLFPFSDGCPVGFECVSQKRFNEPEMSSKVCTPVIIEENSREDEAEPEHNEEPPSEEPDPHS